MVLGTTNHFVAFVRFRCVDCNRVSQAKFKQCSLDLISFVQVSKFHEETKSEN